MEPLYDEESLQKRVDFSTILVYILYINSMNGINGRKCVVEHRAIYV